MIIANINGSFFWYFSLLPPGLIDFLQPVYVTREDPNSRQVGSMVVGKNWLSSIFDSCWRILLFNFCLDHFDKVETFLGPEWASGWLLQVSKSNITLGGPGCLSSRDGVFECSTSGKGKWKRWFLCNQSIPYNHWQNTIREIKRRAQSGGLWPQIVIFPEGTTTNGKALITFKPGENLSKLKFGQLVNPLLNSRPCKNENS